MEQHCSHLEVDWKWTGSAFKVIQLHPVPVHFQSTSKWLQCCSICAGGLKIIYQHIFLDIIFLVLPRVGHAHTHQDHGTDTECHIDHIEIFRRFSPGLHPLGSS